MTLFLLALQASENMGLLEDFGESESQELKEIHKLLTAITKITSHIEEQNETIIQENKILRQENTNLEFQLKLLIQKNKEVNTEVELLISQNKEFRESLDQFNLENRRLKAELKHQNAKLRAVIESLKTENSKLKSDVEQGVKMLRWSESENRLDKKKGFWRHCKSLKIIPGYNNILIDSITAA